jgi:hypothetical protein
VKAQILNLQCPRPDVVCCQLLTEEAWVEFQVFRVGFVVDKLPLSEVSLQALIFLLDCYYSTIASYLSVFRGCKNRPQYQGTWSDHRATTVIWLVKHIFGCRINMMKKYLEYLRKEERHIGTSTHTK